MKPLIAAVALVAVAPVVLGAAGVLAGVAVQVQLVRAAWRVARGG